MKTRTAEEWCEEMFGHRNWVVDTLTIRHILLQGMQEGAERAAEIAGRSITEEDIEEHTGAQHARNAILTASKNWTERDVL